jgi:hypothetical protein
MQDGKTALVLLLSAPFNVVSNPLLTPMTKIDKNYDDLCPSDYRDPWPPTEEEIEMMEWLKEQEDLDRSIPTVRERNRNLK